MFYGRTPGPLQNLSAAALLPVFLNPGGDTASSFVAGIDGWLYLCDADGWWRVLARAGQARFGGASEGTPRQFQASWPKGSAEYPSTLDDVS